MVKSQEQRFNFSEEVYGKWPGSSLYYKGNVKDYDSKSETYTILFDNDDSEMKISAKDIMSKEMAEKQRKTARRRSKSRSPSRRRSRSRSPSRKKAASRITKEASASPQRIGRPKRTKPEEISDSNDNTKPSPRSPARKISQQKAYMKKLESSSVVLKRVESEKSAAIETITTDVVTSLADSTVETTSQRSSRVEETFSSNFSDVDSLSDMTTRLRRRPLQESNISQQVRRVTTRSMTKSHQEDQFSGDERQKKVVNDESSEKNEDLLTSIKTAFYNILVFDMQVISIFLPAVFVLALYQSCGKKSCSITKLPRVPKLEKLFTLESIYYVFGWFLFQAIISSLPLGKLVYGPPMPSGSKLQYRLNGFPAFLISVLTCCALIKYKYVSMVFIVNRLPALIVAACIYGFVISLAVFVHTKLYSNEKSDGIMNDFINGQLVHPRFFNGMLDLKTFHFRTAFLTWGIIVLYYFMKAWNADGINILKTNTSLVLLTAFQISYVLKTFLFEETLLYTYTFSCEKFGYYFLILCSNMWSFCGLQARYLSLYPVALPWYCYIIPVIFHVCGWYIYTMSDLQKSNFRRDPQAAIASGVQHIKTINGKHILVDGMWGKLRHPNYFGDWLIMVSWGALCGFRHFHGWVWPLMFSLQLVFMLRDDDKRCKEKYRSSWDEYRSRVKYSFIPYVY